jgi:ribonucleoside-diphosphate reductase alpha chain
MHISRIFTKSQQDPYSDQTYVERTPNAHSKSDRPCTILVPDTWSQIAVDILGNKYMRKTGVPQANGEFGRETDARQVFRRLASCWMYWGLQGGYFNTEADAQAYADEMQYMLSHQIGAPNSPQWFNTGLYHAYQIAGPAQGLWRYDGTSDEPKQIANAFEHPQASACFIQSIEDNLVNKGGIMDLWTREARLFKYGAGSGTNFSNLRARGERLSSGGVSSGLMSWLKIGDTAAGAIKSGGTTRRAAKMVILNIDHPDIEAFINLKVREEQKVAALMVGSHLCATHLNRIIAAAWPEGNAKAKIDHQTNTELAKAIASARQDRIPETYIQRALAFAKDGHRSFAFSTYDLGWENEGYLSVTGQNANNSVRITRRFLDAVAGDHMWSLFNRTDGSVAKTVRARDLWDQICAAAWQCADPGLQYDDIINEWHTTPAQGRINASNPCSEYLSNDDTACNLASLNLRAFLRPDGQFDLDQYRHAVQLWTLTLDITVFMASYPSATIATRTAQLRQLGLGYANLGAVLMELGIPYDSPEARGLAQGLTALMTGEAYRTSALLASELGTFAHYQENREAMLRVIRNHHHAAFGLQSPELYEGLTVLPQVLNDAHCPHYLVAAARTSWDDALTYGMAHGFRNAQVTVIAPTGTIGLVMDCDTTGVEPDFALVKDKQLAGGGSMKLVNTSVRPALARLGYSSEQIQDILFYMAGHGTLVGCPTITPRKLQERGLPNEMIARIERTFSRSMSLRNSCTPVMLGIDWCVTHFRVTPEEVTHTDFDVLSRLGFTSDEVAQADRYIFGTLTVEGAPHLKPEHLPVFDCANRCGPHSTRSIAPEAHIQMLGAVQPFISGGISKTVNLPANADIHEIDRLYRLAYTLGVKCIAVYRDGCKLSQPLNAIGAGSLAKAVEAKDVGRVAEELAKQTLIDKRSTHRPLPNKRRGYTQKATIGGHKLYIRTGEYADGSLGEIFLDMHKEGAAFRSLMNCFAIAISLGLQYGVPLEEFVDSFTFMRFEPNGPVHGHEQIKMCSSLMDYIMRDLAVQYLDRQDLAQVKITTEDLRADSMKPYAQTNGQGKYLPSANQVSGSEGARDPIVDAKAKGYEGDPCPECNQFTMVRNGTCLRCIGCGATTGCS